MAYRISCEGVDAATFYDDEKTFDYVAYSLSKDGVNTVTITAVDDNGQPVAATTTPENPQPVEQAAPQGPQVIQ